MTTLLSWNVNGLRAIHRKAYWSAVLAESPDIICLQEIKAEAEQLPLEVREPEGYQGYFWSSRERRGYAGTAIYSKVQPNDVRYGLHNQLGEDLDMHGRLITAIFEDVIVINGYFPNGKSKTAPLDYKLKFYEAYRDMVELLQKEFPKRAVITVGDLNVAHTEIDLARPNDNKKTIGFLPEEREWIDEFIAAGQQDLWRNRNPDVTEQYSWWDMRTGARDRNIGWRIDYVLGNAVADQQIKSISYLTETQGSDHCPMWVEFK